MQQNVGNDLACDLLDLSPFLVLTMDPQTL